MSQASEHDSLAMPTLVPQDPEDNGTVWAYNGLDQQTQSVQGQMVAGSGSWAFSNLEQSTLTAAARTYQVYVHFSTTPDNGWQEDYSVSDSNATLSTTTFTPLTGGWYLLGTVTLPADDNSTAVTLTQNYGTASDAACLGYGEQSSYYPDGTPGGGQLETYTDRDGRATTYQYNFVGQETGENWYADTNTLGTATETESFSYNDAGWLQSATDQVTGADPATDSYTYDLAGEVQADSQSVAGLTPTVTLNESYTAGNRTSLSASIGGTNDFVNSYTYGGVMGQMSQVTQQSPAVGDAVAAKTATFQYDWQGELTGVGRYQSASSAANLVAQAAYQYDNDANMTSLAYTRSGNTTALPSYSWTYDAQNNMASATSNSDGTATYTNDSTGQLTGAGSVISPTLDESYSYDTNGNRQAASNTNGAATYTTGPNNELLCDGTNTYAYDANGNCISQTNGSQQILYTWDNRNRLTLVTFQTGNTVTKTVQYTYDAFNRWVGEVITIPGQATQQTRYVYDGNQIVLQFDGTGSGDLVAGNLSHRYLWGPAVDQLMADEQVVNGLSQPGNVVWTLGDNENTIRDLATYNAGTDTTTVVNHRVFSAYGQLLSQTNSSVGCLFAYTGEALDTATGLQNNDNRWYNAITGRWLSQDPSGLGPDVNPYRYVGNAPMDKVDPTGLVLLSGSVYVSGVQVTLSVDGPETWAGVWAVVVGNGQPRPWSAFQFSPVAAGQAGGMTSNVKPGYYQITLRPGPPPPSWANQQQGNLKPRPCPQTPLVPQYSAPSPNPTPGWHPHLIYPSPPVYPLMPSPMYPLPVTPPSQNPTTPFTTP